MTSTPDAVTQASGWPELIVPVADEDCAAAAEAERDEAIGRKADHMDVLALLEDAKNVASQISGRTGVLTMERRDALALAQALKRAAHAVADGLEAKASHEARADAAEARNKELEAACQEFFREQEYWRESKPAPLKSGVDRGAYNRLKSVWRTVPALTKEGRADG